MGWVQTVAAIRCLDVSRQLFHPVAPINEVYTGGFLERKVNRPALAHGLKFGQQCLHLDSQRQDDGRSGVTADHHPADAIQLLYDIKH